MASSGGGGRVWDAEKGVWQGDRAATGASLEVPSPLWIFGYGSLCFRPDFPSDKQFTGRVSGYQRYFAQKSCDHRGTPTNPGLVATLLTDSECVALGVRGESDPPSTCVGTCYRVADADIDGVLANLDFREKGGYSRAVVEVAPCDGSPPVRALLYTATTDNPNFTADPVAAPCATPNLAPRPRFSPMTGSLPLSCLSPARNRLQTLRAQRRPSPRLTARAARMSSTSLVWHAGWRRWASATTTWRASWQCCQRKARGKDLARGEMLSSTIHCTHALGQYAIPGRTRIVMRRRRHRAVGGLEIGP